MGCGASSMNRMPFEYDSDTSSGHVSPECHPTQTVQCEVATPRKRMVPTGDHHDLRDGRADFRPPMSLSHLHPRDHTDAPASSTVCRHHVDDMEHSPHDGHHPHGTTMCTIDELPWEGEDAVL